MGVYRALKRFTQPFRRAIAAFLLLFCSPLVSAETFHAIIIGESSDTKIRGSVQADIALAEQFANGVGQHFESHSITILSGTEATSSAVKGAIQSLDLDLDDFVFVTYSGHGDQSEVGSPWPRLSLRDGELEGRDLIVSLAEKSSLRHLVVFDACNGALEMPPMRAPASTGFRAEHVTRLFKAMEGSIVVTSSEPGYVSYASLGDEPSRFNRVFYQVLSSNLSSRKVLTWDELLNRVKSAVGDFGEGTVQIPKFIASTQS